MTVEQIEDIAYRGEPMPDLRSMAEVMLFQSFRGLYDFARRSQMPPSQGKKEKQQILDTYRVYRFWEEFQEDTIGMWKDLQAATEDYRKGPSIEKANRLLEILYGTKIFEKMEGEYET